MNFRYFALAILLMIAPLAATAGSDESEVTLKNGDKLSGTVVSHDGEALVIETDYAGKITIATAHVLFVKPVKETAKTGTAATVEKPAETAKTEAPPETETVVTKAKSEPKLFGDGPVFGLAEGWDGNASVGFSYTSGNSRTSTLSTGLRAVKNGANDQLTVYLRSLWNSNRKAANSTTQNAVWGGARYDRDLSDKTFFFGSYDFERDRPKKLYFRSVVGGGLGRHLLNNEKTEIDLIAGGAWNRTWQQGPNSDIPEALAGNTLKHRINGRLRFQQSFTFYQNVTSSREFRFIFDSTLSADITKRIGWQFTVGDRFNNDPAGTAKKNDFLFTTGLRWTFGNGKK